MLEVEGVYLEVLNGMLRITKTHPGRDYRISPENAGRSQHWTRKMMEALVCRVQEF